MGGDPVVLRVCGKVPYKNHKQSRKQRPRWSGGREDSLSITPMAFIFQPDSQTKGPTTSPNSAPARDTEPVERIAPSNHSAEELPTNGSHGLMLNVSKGHTLKLLGVLWTFGRRGLVGRP